MMGKEFIPYNQKKVDAWKLKVAEEEKAPADAGKKGAKDKGGK